VSNRDVVAYCERVAIGEVGALVGDMTHHKVLNIRPTANPDCIHITAKNRIWPNGAVVPDGDIPDDLGTWVDIDIRADNGVRIQIF